MNKFNVYNSFTNHLAMMLFKLLKTAVMIALF